MVVAGAPRWTLPGNASLGDGTAGTRLQVASHNPGPIASELGLHSAPWWAAPLVSLLQWTLDFPSPAQASLPVLHLAVGGADFPSGVFLDVRVSQQFGDDVTSRTIFEEVVARTNAIYADLGLL